MNINISHLLFDFAGVLSVAENLEWLANNYESMGDIDLYIFSNSSLSRIEREVRAHNAEHIFTNIFSYDNMPVHKPNAKAFRYVEDQLTSLESPSTLMLIDDSKRNIKSASAAGWQYLYFETDTNSLQDVLAEAIN